MPTPSELKERLESQEEELHYITRKIENRIVEYKDWRALVKRHPFQSFGFAVAAGLVLSGSAAPLAVLALAQLRATAIDSATHYAGDVAKGIWKRL